MIYIYIYGYVSVGVKAEKGGLGGLGPNESSLGVGGGPVILHESPTLHEFNTHGDSPIVEVIAHEQLDEIHVADACAKECTDKS